jgi:hypothetical protein
MMRRVLFLAVTGGFCGFLAFAESAGPRDVVLQRSEIARQRMRQLKLAFDVYWNEHNVPPTDLVLLYPHYVSNPRTFWHPGDSDPRPTTINNSIPNAQNSTRISFDWPLNGSGAEGAGDTVFIQDNSAANNAGQFVNLLTRDGLIETDPPLATPTPTAVALTQAHLRRIAGAFLVYANENFDWYPQDLLQLVNEGWFASPRTFWNPGDSDPLPTEINNSEPNAPNSTQVSFAYLAAGQNSNTFPLDRVFVQDNTPANNGGAFILMATGDGVIETDPPAATPVPTKIALTQAHLRRFRDPIFLYAYEHDDQLPGDLLELWQHGFYFGSPRTFWNPGDSDPLPTTIDNSVSNAPNSTQISFEYRGAGLNWSEIPPETALLRDNTPANNDGYGINALRRDGQVEFIPDCPGDVDGNKRVNWRDLWILLRHLGQQEGATPADGDIDGDGDVDAADLQISLSHMGSVCAQPLPHDDDAAERAADTGGM